jgi:hypothetical protein
MQRLLRERLNDLSGSLPDKEQLKQTGPQVAARASQTASTLKDAAQQTVTKVASTTEQGSQTSTTTPAAGEAEIVIPVDTIAPYETGL